MVHGRWFRGATYDSEKLSASMRSDAEVYTTITLRDGE
jgi:hypothetical protein